MVVPAVVVNSSTSSGTISGWSAAGCTSGSTVSLGTACSASVVVVAGTVVAEAASVSGGVVASGSGASDEVAAGGAVSAGAVSVGAVASSTGVGPPHAVAVMANASKPAIARLDVAAFTFVTFGKPFARS